MTGLLTDEDVLVLLDEQFEEACHYPNCDAPRTHLLTCPECPAAENMCEPHAAAAKLAKPKDRVVFNNTCQHTVFMIDCGKIRLKF
jgi:hypothetical protein